MADIKATHGVSTSFTISLASLATSTTGVGVQTNMVSNQDEAQIIRIYYQVTVGTSPTDNKSIQFYQLTGDEPSSGQLPLRTDGAVAGAGALTIVSAPLVNVIQTDTTSDQTYTGSFLIRNPGPEFGIAVVHDTEVNLNSNSVLHDIRYLIENQSVT